MNITVEQVRDALRKDDILALNQEINRLIPVAKAEFLVATNFQADSEIPIEVANEFEALSNNYIIEYIRMFLDQCDNQKILNCIAASCELLLLGNRT
jgi:hypothetical protein